MYLYNKSHTSILRQQPHSVPHQRIAHHIQKNITLRLQKQCLVRVPHIGGHPLGRCHVVIAQKVGQTHFRLQPPEAFADAVVRPDAERHKGVGHNVGLVGGRKAFGVKVIRIGKVLRRGWSGNVLATG